MTQKKGYVKSIADKGAKFWCGSCILNRKPLFYSPAEDDARLRRSSFETASGSEQILLQRPRLVRGLYLGKEPLEYRKCPTPFRFSFQRANKDITNKELENDRVKNFKRKLIYPKSINVRLCSLQTRPVKRGEYKQDRGERKSDAVRISNILASEVNTTRALRQQTKQVPLLFGKEAKPTDDLKESDKMRLNGKISRQLQEKGIAKSEKVETLRSDHLKRKKKDSELYGTGPYQVEELIDHTEKISVEYYLEYFKFKLSDYDIWSRTSNAC